MNTASQNLSLLPTAIGTRVHKRKKTIDQDGEKTNRENYNFLEPIKQSCLDPESHIKFF